MTTKLLAVLALCVLWRRVNRQRTKRNRRLVQLHKSTSTPAPSPSPEARRRLRRLRVESGRQSESHDQRCGSRSHCRLNRRKGSQGNGQGPGRNERANREPVGHRKAINEAHAMARAIPIRIGTPAIKAPPNMSPMRQLKVLEPADFERLLTWLDPDPDRAGQLYESIRWRLIAILASRGCHDSRRTGRRSHRPRRPAGERYRSDLHR